MAVELKPLKPADAIRALFERSQGLEPTFGWQEIYAQEHAVAATVAKSAGYDILSDIFKGLLKGLSEGSTGRDFAAELTPSCKAKGGGAMPWRKTPLPA